MASDPHTLLGIASIVPGLGSIAAAMDAALYLYEGDYAMAALAGAAILAGGVVLAAKVGREAITLARAGATGIRGAIEGSRVVRALAGPARALKGFLGSVATRVKSWFGKTDDLGRDVARSGDDVAETASKAVREAEHSTTASGSDVVFSGHGSLEPGAGTTIVPEGTEVRFYTKHGDPIWDSEANVIEAAPGSTPAVQVYGPGSAVPNYTLRPPEDLRIVGNPVTVKAPTRLDQLLKPGMGTCHWAACRVVGE